MATIIVTGAAGFIGSHTCDQLLNHGHHVIGIDNFRTGRRDNLLNAQRNSRFALAEINVNDAPRLDLVVSRSRPQAIIHLAALVSVPESISDPAGNFRLNVEATQRVIEVARRHEVRRIVFASSAAVYGDNPALPLTERSETRPISPYGGAKLASEALLLGHGAPYGVTVRCMRYFNVFGPRQDPRSPYSGVISVFVDKMTAGVSPTIFGDGEQTRDFISVHDVARANVMAATVLNLPSGVANICTGIPTTLNHLAAILRDCIPGAPRAGHNQPRPGDIRHSLGSPQRARADLGFTAEVSLQTGLGELVGAVCVSSK